MRAVGLQAATCNKAWGGANDHWGLPGAILPRHWDPPVAGEKVLGQSCIKLGIGPRAVPARSADKHARLLGTPERPGAAASRDGSRSGELEAARFAGQASAHGLRVHGQGPTTSGLSLQLQMRLVLL